LGKVSPVGTATSTSTTTQAVLPQSNWEAASQRVGSGPPTQSVSVKGEEVAPPHRPGLRSSEQKSEVEVHGEAPSSGQADTVAPASLGGASEHKPQSAGQTAALSSGQAGMMASASLFGVREHQSQPKVASPVPGGLHDQPAPRSIQTEVSQTKPISHDGTVEESAAVLGSSSPRMDEDAQRLPTGGPDPHLQERNIACVACQTQFRNVPRSNDPEWMIRLCTSCAGKLGLGSAAPSVAAPPTLQEDPRNAASSPIY